jgi:hypothetical protein
LTPDRQQFHWSEGNKYALEAMKALLWLNGGSAAALLTLFGGARPRLLTPDFGHSVLSFAIGTVLSVLLFAVGYLTQLAYGNFGLTKIGQTIHKAAYFILAGAVGAFLFGLWFAYSAVMSALGA